MKIKKYCINWYANNNTKDKTIKNKYWRFLKRYAYKIKLVCHDSSSISNNINKLIRQNKGTSNGINQYENTPYLLNMNAFIYLYVFFSSFFLYSVILHSF